MNLTQVITGPVVTEKAMRHSENNQVVLHIHSDATKTDVKSALKKYFSVEADGVRIVYMPVKIRVRGKHGPQAKRKPKKKAIISLKKGQSFDILKMAGTATKKPAKKPADKAAEKPTASSTS